ncbi:MAG TPA: contractile injection system tape measure protein, partial [Puia sp.]|nr:contractile injection system tape measure protein [Puia sp.]
MKHLVRKQVIEVSLDAGQDAFSIQQQIRDYYDHQIMPVLEKVFDELSTDGEIIEMDKLEIDLGDLGWKNNRFILDTDSIHRIVKQSFLNAFSSRHRAHPDTIVLHRTPEENACRQWLYYMEWGILPWAIQSTDTKWFDQVLHQLAIDFGLIQQTKKLITENYWFLARLVHEHSEFFLQQLIEVMTARKHPNLISQVNELLKPSGAEAGEPALRKKQIWE